MEDNQINHELNVNESDSIDSITLRFSNLLKLLDNDPSNVGVEDNSTLSKLKDLYKDISAIQQSVEKYKLLKEGQDLYTKWLLLAEESGLWGEGGLNRENSTTNQLEELAALSYNNRGYLKYLQVDFEGAIQDYTRALKHNSTLSCAYYNRGIVAYRLAFFDQAVLDMKTAVSLEPNSRTFREGLEKVTDMAGSPNGHNFRLDYDEVVGGQGS